MKLLRKPGQRPLFPQIMSPSETSKRVDPLRPLPHILVAVDFSSQSKKAVECAASLARPLQAAITLVHVVEPIPCQADYGYGPVIRNVCNTQKLKEARSRLNRLASKVISRRAIPETIVLSGTPFFEITEAARALNTDLILVGGHPNERPESDLGSTAERVVRHAPCPVLVLSRKKVHPKQRGRLTEAAGEGRRAAPSDARNGESLTKDGERGRVAVRKL